MENDRALAGLLEPHRSHNGSIAGLLPVEPQASRPRRMKRRPALTVEQQAERDHHRSLFWLHHESDAKLDQK